MLTQIGEFPNLSWHHRFFISLPTDRCQKWTSELKWSSCSNPSTKNIKMFGQYHTGLGIKFPKFPIMVIGSYDFPCILVFGDWQSWLSLLFQAGNPAFPLIISNFLLIVDRLLFQALPYMGHSRKDPHSPHGGNLFLIIVSVLGHPKGVRSGTVAVGPPIVETRRKIIDVVGMFMVKHRKKGLRKSGKSVTKAIVMLLSGKNVVVQKNFSSLGFVGKVLPLPPPPNMGPTAPLGVWG